MTIDIACEIPVEIRDRLMMVADRRGFGLNEIMTMAVTEFVEREFEKPTPLNIDAFINDPGQPNNKKLVSYPLNRMTSLQQFPQAKDCPKDKIDEWIEVLTHDMGKIERQIEGFMKAQAEGVPADLKVFQNVLEKYGLLRQDLVQRKRSEEK